MSIERRATRRSTAENRIASEELEKKPIEKMTKIITPEIKKLGEVNNKEIVPNDENIVTVQDGNCVGSGKEIDDEEDEVALGDEDDEGAPEPKMAKLCDDDAEEQTNGNGDQPAKKGRKEKVTFPCSECDKKFLKKSFLTKHIKTHSQPRPFVCDIDDCDKSFIQMKALEKHVKTVHRGEDDTLHLCQFCQKGFITRAEMESHAESHLQEYKMYACRFCGKTFNKKFAMKIAIQASQDQISEPCPYCNKVINAKAYSDN